MSKIRTIAVTKRDGALDYSKLEMDKLIDDLADGVYLLQLVPARKRTQAQIAYYRGVVLPRLAEANGGSYTAEEWHQILTKKFLQFEYDKDGEIHFGVRSTSEGGKMTAEEFATYLDQVILFALEQGVSISSPSHYEF